jgi:hypothetical protein
MATMAAREGREPHAACPLGESMADEAEAAIQRHA